MRRIVCLFLLIAGCDSSPSTGNPDLSMILNEDGGGDAGGTCVEGAACTLSGGAKGLCKSNLCAACVAMTDDLACDTAYSEPMKHFICGAGGCVQGCRTSAASECGGQICGLTSPNVCSGCTGDSQCQMAFTSDSICNIATGKCSAGDCTNAGSACSANSADLCCAAGVGLSCATGTCCVTGSCCVNAECGDAGKGCVNHVCTTCSAPSGNVLVVDPSEGPGGAPTGADTAGCRYKTITAAMTHATAGMTIKVLGTKPITGSTACTDVTIECFPIPVKAGVMVVGDSTMVPTIQVSAGTGFQLAGAGSGLSNLILDGVTATGDYGIDVEPAGAPSPSPAPAIDHVTVKAFNVDGIVVNGGTLDVKQGVASSGSTRGMDISSFAHVRVIGGGDVISFSQNTGVGVRVVDSTVTMTGSPSPSPSPGGTGTIVANSNHVGIQIQATPGGGAPTVSLTGVVAWSNSGNGVEILAGSPTVMRSCSVLKNALSGVDVKVGNAASQDVTVVDLGKNKNGKNLLQDVANPNEGAGVCNETNGNLDAQGNTFQSHDCSAATPAYTVTTDTKCSPSPRPSPLDVGITTASPPPAGKVTVSNCGP